MSNFQIRPSSLPALRHSPLWESSGPSEATEAGTKRHDALEQILRGNGTELADKLPDNEKEAVLWAADLIQAESKMSGAKIVVEERISIEVDGTTILGTPDAVVGNVFFDLKWRKFDYEAQMAAYALGLMKKNGTTSIACVVLFGDGQFCKLYEFGYDYTYRLVKNILVDVSTATECRISQYCDWCAKKLSCQTLANKALQVANIRQVDNLLSPVSVAQALVAAKAVESWADAVREKAVELAKAGMLIPGFTLRTKRGAREIDPERVADAFLHSGLSSEEFLACCKVRIGELEKRYAKSNGLPLKVGKEQIAQKISAFTVEKPETTYLERE